MVEAGKTVKVHYKGTLADGSCFDSSEGREPLEFTVGSGQVIPGFDAAIQQMDVGETRTVSIPCDQAYGERREDLVATIGKENMEDGLNPEVGQILQINTPQGPLPVRVIEVNDQGLVIDGNHPLAGKDLTFELTVVEAV